MNKTEKNAVRLFRRLLDITKQEQLWIEMSNIDKLEHYSLMKKYVVKDIEEMKESELWLSDPEERAEVESILKEINRLNSDNMNAVRDIRNKVMGRIYDQKKRKAAVNAYNKLA